MAYTDTSAIIKDKFKIGEVQLSASEQTTIDLGFKPIFLCVWWSVRLYMYDERYSTTQYRGVTTSGYSSNYPFDNTGTNRIYKITNNGFIMTENSALMHYFAIGESEMSSLRKYAFGSGTFSTTSQTKVVCGFKPKQVLLFRDNNALAMYDERYATTKVKYGTPSAYLQDQNLGVTTNGRITSIDDDGFTFNKDASAYPYLWFALG